MLTKMTINTKLVQSSFIQQIGNPLASLDNDLH
jgi:hypothetical protein